MQRGSALYKLPGLPMVYKVEEMKTMEVNGGQKEIKPL